MSYIVTVRGKLKGEPEDMKKLHDQVTAVSKDSAMTAGDTGHKVFLNPEDKKDFLGMDEWATMDAFQKFSADPKIQEFFGQLFDGQPEVKVRENPGWNQW